MRIAQLIVAGSIIAGSIGFAHAQATAGAGSVIVIPLIAKTVSYSTEVTVRNPNPAQITLNVRYYEANNASAPGLVTCTPLTVEAIESKPFSLSTQCGVTGDAHFGLLVLEDSAAQKTNVFFAYSRSQTPGGNGFSVEGFPVGAFSGAPSDVVGLKRQAASPPYRSNCFVAALGEAVGYQLVLRNGTTNAIIGAPLTGTLQPFQQLRYLDVFERVGVPAGDFTNVRANFTVTTGGQALVGLCTVEERSTGGADFRIAKSIDSLNHGQKRVACIGMDDCAALTSSASDPEEITDPTMKNIYSMIITQPDFVRCNLVSARLSELQMRLRQWGDPFNSAPVAGGAGQTSFYAFTGNRNAVNGGTATRWFIDVSARDGATGTFDFGITCRSGNGTEVPWLLGTDLKNF